MAGTLIELFDSRAETWGATSTSNVNSAELNYIAYQCADEAEVKTLAESTVPSTYAGLNILSISITERINANTWKVQARYGVPQPYQEEAPEPETSFDTAGGTQHITQSLATTRYPLLAPDLQGTIGYDGENVNGVDIPMAAFNFQELHYLTDEQVDGAAYQVLTGKINADTFRGFAPGELLFLGAYGRKRGKNGLWEITFKFSAQENKTGLEVGSITGIAKRGWDYLWVRYGETTSGNNRIKVPVAVYVEEVYEEGAFSALGI
jgi:hypothetical protein